MNAINDKSNIILTVVSVQICATIFISQLALSFIYFMVLQ